MATDTDRSAATAAEVVPVAGVVVASAVPETLFGLDEKFDAARASNLERAVVATLDHHRRAGLVTEAMAGKVALATELAAIIADKRARGRTSTVSNDARLLSEILDGFVAEEGAGNEALRQAMERWTLVLAGAAAGQQAIAAAS